MPQGGELRRHRSAGPRSGQPRGFEARLGVRELGHPAGESDWPTITPPQVRAAVWQSLIAGARGIVYFNHSFGGPDQTQHILRDGTDPNSPYAPIRSVVTSMNHEIAALARVLNSPSVTSGWSHSGGTTAMVKWEAASKAKKCRSNKRKRKKKCKRAEGKASEGSQGQEEMQVQESKKRKKCGSKKTRSRRLSCSPARLERPSRAGSRCPASATQRPPSWTRTAAFPSATVPSATTSPAGTRFTSIASTAHRSAVLGLAPSRLAAHALLPAFRRRRARLRRSRLCAAEPFVDAPTTSRPASPSTEG